MQVVKLGNRASGRRAGEIVRHKWYLWENHSWLGKISFVEQDETLYLNNLTEQGNKSALLMLFLFILSV